MNKSWQIPRRSFLRGLGTLVALPALEAMLPAPVVAVPGAAAGPVKRMAFVYIPNGANMPEWTPKTLGKNYELSPTLQPLKDFKNDFLVLSGLAHTKARANGDGAGDHARANATFLTGVQARKTAGADIRVGISVDQIAAQKVGGLTRFPSLELSCDRGRNAGSCDSGYSCAYQFNLAWRSESSPMAPEVDPRLVFNRLFAGKDPSETAEARAKRRTYQKSVLDFVMDDARRLKGNLGHTDQRKLDEYLTSVRELEERIEKAEKFADKLPDMKIPAGVPKDFEPHVRLMYDLMTVAFQTDSTRIATLLSAHDGSNRAYPSIGVSEGHHDLSHHGRDEGKLAKIAKINTLHVQQFAYFLNKLKSVQEGEGTLLDNCMIVYGSAIADGNAHAHHDLPLLLAGRGGGTIQPGRHAEFAQETPAANLFLAMLDRMNAPTARLGDSTGKLDLNTGASSGPSQTADRVQLGGDRKKKK